MPKGALLTIDCGLPTADYTAGLLGQTVKDDCRRVGTKQDHNRVIQLGNNHLGDLSPFVYFQRIAIDGIKAGITAFVTIRRTEMLLYGTVGVELDIVSHPVIDLPKLPMSYNTGRVICPYGIVPATPARRGRREKKDDGRDCGY